MTELQSELSELFAATVERLIERLRAAEASKDAKAIRVARGSLTIMGVELEERSEGTRWKCHASS